VLSRLAELLQYRELIKNLVARDLKVRYRHSVLGFLWCLGNPLLMTLVFTVVFTVLLRNNIPKFPVFLLCALLPWNFFSAAVVGAINSVVGNEALINKVYFPREILPIAVVLSNLVNFLLASVVLFGMLLVFRTPLTLALLFLPLVIIVQVAFTLGVGFFLASLNVFFRDTAIIMEAVLLAWFFLTPVFYPIEVLPQHYPLLGLDLDVRRLMYIVNPMASLAASYRDVLYSGVLPGLDFFARTAVTACAVLALGYLFFTRTSRAFGEAM
jgi:ABC-type polysaccharide/polyol phosphate export permease